MRQNGEQKEKVQGMQDLDFAEPGTVFFSVIYPRLNSLTPHLLR